MLGGPVHQLWLKTRVARVPLELDLRRVVALALLAWLPLLVLSLVGGRAWSGSVAIPFLFDPEVHVRFLVGLPLLVLAEGYVHRHRRQLNFGGADLGTGTLGPISGLGGRACPPSRAHV